MSNRVSTFNLLCVSLTSTFSNLATHFWFPVYSMPGEDLIAKPGELPAFDLIILVTQKYNLVPLVQGYCAGQKNNFYKFSSTSLPLEISSTQILDPQC